MKYVVPGTPGKLRTAESMLRELAVDAQRMAEISAQNDAEAEHAAEARLARTRQRIAGKLNVIGDGRKQKVRAIIDGRVRIVQRIERDPAVARATIHALREIEREIMEDWDR